MNLTKYKKILDDSKIFKLPNNNDNNYDNGVNIDDYKIELVCNEKNI